MPTCSEAHTFTLAPGQAGFVTDWTSMALGADGRPLIAFRYFNFQLPDSRAMILRCGQPECT